MTFGAADTLNGTVKEGEGWALRNYGTIPVAADWDVSHALNYAAANDVELWNGDKGDASTASVSAKVTYHWSDYTRTYLEMGYFDDKKTVNGLTTIAAGQNTPLRRRCPTVAISQNCVYSSAITIATGITGRMPANRPSTMVWTTIRAVGIQANVFW